MYINVYVVVYVALFAVINYFVVKKNGGNVYTINLNLDLFKNKLIISIWIWLIILFMYCGNSAFIYAQF